MNINYSQVLNQIRNNNNAMNNQTVKAVFDCLDKRDHNSLVELYKNTCNTLGQKPNQMFLQ